MTHNGSWFYSCVRELGIDVANKLNKLAIKNTLFKDLEKKPLSPNHIKIMRELLEEHVWARNVVGRLVDAKNLYVKGDTKVIDTIISLSSELVEFYPKHIDKEDKHFFIPVMEYFTEEEQDKMLQEFWEFDKTLIHEKYEKVVENL